MPSRAVKRASRAIRRTRAERAQLAIDFDREILTSPSMPERPVSEILSDFEALTRESGELRECIESDVLVGPVEQHIGSWMPWWWAKGHRPDIESLCSEEHYDAVRALLVFAARHFMPKPYEAKPRSGNTQPDHFAVYRSRHDPLPSVIDDLTPKMAQAMLNRWPALRAENWPDGGYALLRGHIVQVVYGAVARARGMRAPDLGLLSDFTAANDVALDMLASLPWKMRPEHFGHFHEVLCGYELRDGKVVGKQPKGAKREKKTHRPGGQHFTPPRMAMRIVIRTMEPLLKAYPGRPLLSFRTCDPAVGAGAFPLALVRWLAPRVLHRGEAKTLVEAKRLVAMHCVYGVDNDRFGVHACKLALSLECRGDAMPDDWLDDNIKHGNALVGLHSREQFEAFHWKGSDAETRELLQKTYEEGIQAAAYLRRTRLEALSQAARSA